MAKAIATEHLRFAPEILRRLGEELIPHPDQGIVELARNSYDADAHECTVELISVDQPGGTIRIIDDGVGMDRNAIVSGWLLVGRSPKEHRQLTALGRIPAGDKGLGRLAALRMGRRALVRTRPQREAGFEYEIDIDWADFERHASVEEVPIEVRKAITDAPQGTMIEVTELDISLSREDVDRLARALVLLADPFDAATSFRPRLVTPEFGDLERKVRESYFDYAEYRMVAELSQSGFAHVSVVDGRGRELFGGEHKDISKTPSKPYDAPPAKFELWVFLLTRSAFAGRGLSMNEVKQWLSIVGGVHLYQNGLRVRPYGDSGHDWLDMNLRRARSPEERPSTNTSIGRVTVDDPDQRLVQKTDREGFVEGNAYKELRRFAMESLDWTASRRLALAERTRRRGRREAVKDLAGAKQAVVTQLEGAPPVVKAAVGAALTTYDNAVKREISALQSEVQLYRTLSTIGTTTAVFAHEAAKPVSQIERLSRVIATRARRLLGHAYEEELAEPVDLVRRSAVALQTYVRLPLGILQSEKRRVGRSDLHIVIANMISLLKPFLDDAKIQVVPHLAKEDALVYASAASLESIIANLLVNSVSAFTQGSKPTLDRSIEIHTEVQQDEVIMRVLDNGPGIRGLTIEQIWLPGYTTIPGGTGLGLTIVRDAVEDLGGSVSAVASGELGGAEFNLVFPRLT